MGARRGAIAEVAERLMLAEDVPAVVWGDGLLVTIGYAAGLEQDHPLKIMGRVISALARDARFDPYHIRGCDSRARSRRVRAFRLKTHPAYAEHRAGG